MKREVPTKSNHFAQRSCSASSIIELLVAVAILGVALAGITDLLWMNTSWTNRFLNRTSAMYKSQVFMKRLETDLESAYRISTDSDTQTLIIWLPVTESKISTNPFPPRAKTIAEGDSDRVSYIVTSDSIIRTAGGKPWTVLTGLVGPRKIGETQISVFQYVEKSFDSTDPAFGVQSKATNGARAVMVDIEVTDRNFGKSKPSDTNVPSDSDVQMRSEFILRNELGMN